MKSKGFSDLYTLGLPRETRRRSATNSMYLRDGVKSQRRVEEAASAGDAGAQGRRLETVIEREYTTKKSRLTGT